jgi:hypothetical protein
LRFRQPATKSRLAPTESLRLTTSRVTDSGSSPRWWPAAISPDRRTAGPPDRRTGWVAASPGAIIVVVSGSPLLAHVQTADLRASTLGRARPHISRQLDDEHVATPTSISNTAFLCQGQTGSTSLASPSRAIEQSLVWAGTGSGSALVQVGDESGPVDEAAHDLSRGHDAVGVRQLDLEVQAATFGPDEPRTGVDVAPNRGRDPVLEVYLDTDRRLAWIDQALDDTHGRRLQHGERAWRRERGHITAAERSSGVLCYHPVDDLDTGPGIGIGIGHAVILARCESGCRSRARHSAQSIGGWMGSLNGAHPRWLSVGLTRPWPATEPTGVIVSALPVIPKIDKIDPPPGIPDGDEHQISGDHLVARAPRSEGVDVVFTLCGGMRQLVWVMPGCCPPCFMCSLNQPSICHGIGNSGVLR